MKVQKKTQSLNPKEALNTLQAGDTMKANCSESESQSPCKTAYLRNCRLVTTKGLEGDMIQTYAGLCIPRNGFRESRAPGGGRELPRDNLAGCPLREGIPLRFALRIGVPNFRL